MSGLHDGVNKAFLVQHRHGAMSFEGFRDQRDMVETMMGWTPIEESPESRIAWLESLKAKIDASVLRIKQDNEIDGHRRPAENEVESE